MKFTPNEGQLLIKLFKRKEKTAGGIVIVRNDKDADKDTNLAEVVAVPAEFKKYKVQDVVLIRVFAGAWVDPEIMPDQEYVYRVIQDSEVLGKIEQVEEPVFSAV
jgi:co-chaperonin GroES (HSP10)